MADEFAPFGCVLAAILRVRGLLKKGVVRGIELHNKARDGQEIGYARMDGREGHRCLTVWCLAVGKNTKDVGDTSDSDCETLNSQTSYDYPGDSTVCALASRKHIGTRADIRRVGIFFETLYITR